MSARQAVALLFRRSDAENAAAFDAVTTHLERVVVELLDCSAKREREIRAEHVRLSALAGIEPRIASVTFARFAVRSRELEAHDRAGCAFLRRRRSGRVVGVYRAAAAGIDVDSSMPWVVVYEEHGTHAGARSALDASSTETTAFCDACREEAPRA